MKFKKLKLFTAELEPELKFYSQTLGFELLERTKTSFSVKVGWSELTFEESEEDHLYHYCFLIPSNQLDLALESQLAHQNPPARYSRVPPAKRLSGDNQSRRCKNGA